MTAEPGGGAAARFEDELRRFVSRRVPGPDAEDVLQEALLRVHLGVGGLRTQERLAPWVFRVARSAIADHFRRRPAGGIVPEEPGDESDELESAAVREWMARCVGPFVESLPEEQAEALRLTDLGGLTQREAAARLGVPLPTLKARVQRGRHRLRESFEQCCALGRDGRGRVVEMHPREPGCGEGCAGARGGGDAPHDSGFGSTRGA